MLRDRDPVALLAPLRAAGVDVVVACPAPSERTLPAASVEAAAMAGGLRAQQAATVADALEVARSMAGPDDRIVVAGSLYVVAAAREVLGFGGTDPTRIDGTTPSL